MFDTCVTPGKNCKTSNDCGENEYCETELGEGSGGAGGEAGAGGAAGGAVCSQPLPTSGKCLALPPLCDGNGGLPAGCVGKCEYIPKVDAGGGAAGGRELRRENGKTPTSCHTGVLRVLDGCTGEEIWSNAVPVPGSPGFSGVSVTLGDIDKDGTLDVVAVDGNGLIVAFDAAGKLIGSSTNTLPGASADLFGWGGGLALGDMDGDGFPEIAYARSVYTTKDLKATGKFTPGWATWTATGYRTWCWSARGTCTCFGAPREPTCSLRSAIKPNLETMTLGVLWKSVNHDLSSSVTGSSVFDFEGDGRAEVIYNDECFLWVYDGVDGSVRFADFTSSFTGTESSVVADVDGDGHAEIVLIGNSADPGPNGWKCNIAPWNQPDPVTGRPAWKPGPGVGGSYRGIRVFGDSANSWVGTRPLWSQHAYHVTNICSGDDSACDGAENTYGTIPASQKENWKLSWLNNFRQNVQDKGLFNAPDAILSLSVSCDPFEAIVSVKNVGQAALPAGVEVEVRLGNGGASLGKVKTSKALSPGQTEKLPLLLPDAVTEADTFEAAILIDPKNPTFRECKEDNNTAGPVQPSCIKP